MFRTLYKQSVDLGLLQSERRQKILDEIKEKRHSQHDNLRQLEEKLKDAGDEHDGIQMDIESNNNNSRGGVVQNQSARGNHQYYKKYHKNFIAKYKIDDISLQLSEWLYGPPENLDDWLAVPCPVGQRVMVVANRGITEIYGKNGHFICSFKSLLPNGGARKDSYGMSIFDCFFVRKTNQLFMLDIIALKNSLSFLEYTAELRFFMLKGLFEKSPDLESRSHYNQKTFHPLKVYDFKSRDIALELFNVYPCWPDDNPKLDGILFYHREGCYTCGETPLVGWLFPYMVPSILGLPVNQMYIETAPNEYFQYDSPIDFMKDFNAKLALKRAKRYSRSEERKRSDERDDNKENRAENVDTMEASQGNEEGDGDGEGCKDVMEEQMLLETGMKD